MGNRTSFFLLLVLVLLLVLGCAVPGSAAEETAILQETAAPAENAQTQEGQQDAIQRQQEELEMQRKMQQQELERQRKIQQEDRIRSAQFQQAREEYLALWEDLLAPSQNDRVRLQSNSGLTAAKHQLLQETLPQYLREIEEDQSLTEEEKVARILHTLFQTEKLDYYDQQDTDLRIFFVATEPMDPGSQYFLDWAALSKGRLQIEKEKGQLVRTEVNYVEVQEVNCEGTEATAHAMVKEMAADPDGTIGGHVHVYEIQLQKTEAGWKISYMRSDDPQERHFLEAGKRLNVAERLEKLRNPPPLSEEAQRLNAETEKKYQAYLEELERRKQAEEEETANNQSYRDYAYRTYDRNKAAEFAIEYDSSPCTDYFNFNSSGDCQNFASQCLWYGFGGVLDEEAIDGKAYPMIASGSRAWHPAVTSWTFVPTFESYMEDGGYDQSGPYGFLHYGDLGNTMMGDIILVNWEGEASSGSQDHAYIVTEVTGAYGSREMSNIRVSAHTNLCNNEWLTYTGQEESDFLLISVGEWVAPE